MTRLEVVYLTRMKDHAETYNQVLKRLQEARIEVFVAQLGRDAGILVKECDEAMALIVVRAVLIPLIQPGKT